ncbi:M20/M25/M40 family metallo-hydrolase [Pseudoalteromonas peptidolytica]|uniref:Aminopeptidase n=1 Tax=Pseudoalteromonas peptidolytica F12-50-A1 TaxID=1315280 RepID=A0A8I0T4A4_9GAMM|nr:M20/M25/M40 family metallo-hydrolase [Pseudoalteromonas peptidolytica]MBE0345978.1 aminopeptidase [Pseudoalteromonas peptidolytica F12-50-A1]NLR14773.1 M20/M25/M40 family metallo-hydrolase [Pseudoalteromonas peptidolytica]GEK10601.1 peptidase M28 [Pseudoalteromonas peptidolytica]
MLGRNFGIACACVLFVWGSLPSVQAQSGSLITDLETLTSVSHRGRKSGSKSPNISARYIYEAFRASGANPKYQQFTFRAGIFSKDTGHNVTATLPCTQPRCDTPIVISAHYDHLGTTGRKHYPGANDNASGTAAMLYIARQLAKTNRSRDILFVATDAEERGLHGAKFYAKQLNQDIAVNINLDMLGVNKSNRLFALFSPGFSQFKSQLKSMKQAPLKLTVVSSQRQMARYADNPSIDWHKASDHYAFYRNGIPYIYFGIGEDKHHHTTKDTVKNMDIDKYQAGVALISDFILSLTRSPLDSTS